MKKLTLTVAIALLTITTNAQNRPRTDAIPKLSTAIARESLRGKSLENIRGESAGPADWTFSDAELIELDIIETERIGKKTVAVVQIKTADASHLTMFTDTPSGPSYHPKIELEGRLRLTFENIAGDFSLLNVENVSVKYRFRPIEFSKAESASESQPSPENNTFRQAVANSTFHVRASGWTWFPFTLNRQSRVSGNFYAQGGGRNNIEGLVMTENEFINWRNGNQNLAFYRSGKVTIGSIDVVLNPGRYMIVFYNSDLFTGKTVTASVFAQ